MNDNLNEYVTGLIFEKIESIIIADAKNNSYEAAKRTGIFEKIIDEKGSYTDLIEKFWLHFNNSENKITEDYHIFIPNLGKFSGKYSNRLMFFIENKVHLVQISIFPLDTNNDKYMFFLYELDNSEYIQEFLTGQKVNTIQNIYLFSMYVDLLKDSTNSINVTEISNDSINYDMKYSEWRKMIVNMFLPEDQQMFLERTDPEYLKKHLLPEHTTSYDCQMKNLEGKFIWVKLIFSRAQTSNAEDFRFVFMVQDIHKNSMELFDTLKKYENLASKDALTGVFNHGRIETEIGNAVEVFKSKKQTVSLMMIDIDYFKKVNDTFGHSTGDVILKQFVDVIVENVKDYNIQTGRWGGEEFVCVCYDLDINQSEKIAECLRQKISQTVFEKDNHLTCSIGLTQISENNTPKELFDRIDSAMYKAKNRGRNCVIVE